MRTGISSTVIALRAALIGALLGAGWASAQNAEPAEPAQNAATASPIESASGAAAGVVDKQPKANRRMRPTRVDPLEARVRLLSRELDLNPEQQHAVRQILQGQREAVRHIWQDPSIAPAERAPAVRAVSNQTADRIRAVLNEEQRKKYNRALPNEALTTQSNADVEGWLKAVRGQTSENPLGVPLPSATVAAPAANTP